MSYRVKGTLKLPDGSPASNAEIEFISRKNFSPLVQELKSNILCGLDGAYDVTLEYGEYAVLVYPGGTYPAALGTIVLAADTVAGQDLPTLLQQSGWQPATPEYIQQIAAWLAEANASATSSAASASAAKVSETNAKASENAALSSNNSAASSASTATTKAAEAASSASAALASKNAAATSEANALASNNSAATSATTASAGASTATTKASEASASATAAKVSQDAAKVSETNAAASAGAAASAIVTHEGKAGAHPISGVTGLQAALDGKYSPANKPTASDVGALAISGGQITGPIIVRDHYASISTKDGANLIRTSGDDSNATVVGNSRGQTYIDSLSELINIRVGSDLTQYNMYHTGYKPTAADVGALAIADAETVGDGLMRVNGPRDQQITTDAAGLATQLAEAQSKIAELEAWPQSGSNANGSWIKHRDGTLVCTGKRSLSTLKLNNPLLINYPMAFIAAPNITYSIMSYGGNYYTAPIYAFNADDNAPTRFSMYSQAASAPPESVLLNYYVIGRWK